MKRIVLAAVAVALFASCKPKKCPTCDACPPPQPPCPEATCDVKLEDAGKSILVKPFYLVEKDGKYFLTTTDVEKHELAIPITETTPVYVDGQQTTGGETFSRGPGSCPCRLPQCLPYCRPIGSVLTTQPAPTPQ
jgi:hypothetical protein